MKKLPINERLASLEAKVEILLDILKDIREDIKYNPSKEDVERLEQRIQNLEEEDKKHIWKMAGASGTLSVIVAIVTALVVKFLTH